MAETVERQFDTDGALATAWVDRTGIFCRRRLLAWSLIVVVYLIGVCPAWWPTSDSALYLSLSRSLAEGRGFVYNGQTHTLVTPGCRWCWRGWSGRLGPGILRGICLVLFAVWARW